MANAERTLKEEQIIECTGARIEDGGAANHKAYQVQLDGAWINVDHETYERVRQIQDSCA